MVAKVSNSRFQNHYYIIVDFIDLIALMNCVSMKQLISSCKQQKGSINTSL